MDGESEGDGGDGVVTAVAEIKTKEETLFIAIRLDVYDFGKESAKCAMHVFLCYLLMSLCGCSLDIALGTGVTLAGTRLFGEEKNYFNRTLERMAKVTVKKL